jgi:hypothetical protein
MKLAEVKQIDGDRVYLRGGYFLQRERAYTTPQQQVWTLNSIMHEDEPIAEVSISKGGVQPEDVIFKISPFTKHPVISLGYRPLSEKQKLEAFYDWVEKNYMKILKEDLFADSRKARQAKSNLSKPVYMVRLNKDGAESGMKDAITYYSTEEEAKAHHDRLVKNNPRSKIAHHMYSFNGEETFKTKFVNGKVVALKGGIAGEPNIEDAVHDFIQMLDDEGSAAGIWMPYAKKEELYKLYKAKNKVKSVGLDVGDLEKIKADAKIDKKIKSLEANGWKLFAKEESSGYVDMVFTKAA